MLLATSSLFAADQSKTDAAWATLQAGLNEAKPDKRVQAVSALGLISRDKKAIQAAEKALDDPNPDVCSAAITALGEMDSKASLPKIKALVDHSNGKVVLASAAVLTKFKDPEGYELYYEVLTGKRKDGGSVLDGIKDKKSLEKMGVQSAIGVLPFGGVATGAYDYFKQDSSGRANIDVAAVTALAKDPDPVAGKALVQASFGGKEVVRLAALRALAKRGDPTVVDDVESSMYSDKPLISYTAAATIIHLLDPHAKQQS